MKVRAEAGSEKGSQVGAYTKPLGLMEHVARPAVKLDVVPVLDLLVIALLFGLLFTRFVMVPGLQVDLPDSEMQMQPGIRPVSVLTIGNRGMLLFDGGVFEMDTIAGGFENHIREKSRSDVVLLVKTEGTMDLQGFLELCRMAQAAGFVQVQIAGEHLPEVKAQMPGIGDSENLLDGGFLSVM